MNKYIDYKNILQRNLEKVLHDVLSIISTEGLKNGHHLFITFNTTHPDVKIPSWLKKKYKNEITIVLQNEYWNLKTTKSKFSVDLSFNNIPVNIEVPFSSVHSFADPKENFGLKISENIIQKHKIDKKQKNKNKIIKLEQYRKN